MLPFLPQGTPPKLMSIDRMIDLLTDVPALISRLSSRYHRDFDAAVGPTALAPLLGADVDRLVWTFRWKADEYQKQAQDPDRFVKDLQAMATWQRDLEKTPLELTQGVLRVEAAGMGERVGSEVARVVRDMTSMIMTIVTRGCSRLQTLCETAIGALKERPTQLADFASFIKSMAVHYSEVR